MDLMLKKRWMFILIMILMMIIITTDIMMQTAKSGIDGKDQEQKNFQGDDID